MAQYKIGSVNVTNGSATVTGIGTLWSAEVSSGDIFTIVGDNAWYEIGSVGSNTSITLTSNYAGTTASGAQYAISRDFTTNKSIPYPQKGDIETASLLKRAMNIIDTELSTGFDSSNVTITGGTINGTTIGGTTAAAGAFTTLSASGAVTLSGGTANGVPYLNGSKVVTTGSALTFNGSSQLTVNGGAANTNLTASTTSNTAQLESRQDISYSRVTSSNFLLDLATLSNQPILFTVNNAEQMRLTSTGLGIGTSSPGAKLGVFGDTYVIPTSAASTNGVYFRNATNATTFAQVAYNANNGELSVGTTQAYSLLLTTNNTTKATLDSSGNLGLGVTPSAWGALKGLDISSGGALFGFTAQVGLAHNAFFNGSSWRYKNTDAAAFFRANALGFEWHTAPSGTAGNAISFTQAMTLDANGNLGVGATSPGGSATARQLTLFGTSSQISVSVSAFTANFGNNGTVGYVEVTGANPLGFYTNGTERARIDSSGNFGIGTTIPASYGRLAVNGTASILTNGAARFYNSANNNWSYIDNPSTDGTAFLRFATGGGEAMRLDSSGNLIQSVPTTPPTLATNGTMVFNLTSNTNLRVSVRGSDGVTRTANITLA